MTDRATRGRLALIVAQAWPIGAVGGTLTYVAGICLIDGFTFPFAPMVTVSFFATLLSAPVGIAGLLIVMAAPAFVVRWRTPLCDALPFVAVAAWTALVGAADPAQLLMVGFDAAFAGAWCWWHFRRITRDRSRDVARVFE